MKVACQTPTRGEGGFWGQYVRVGGKGESEDCDVSHSMRSTFCVCGKDERRLEEMECTDVVER